ncbi:uncharacterized protein N7479_008875 [Penicillium vulpinum]|uniref:uncharacterized protein n=1 Tax=Penicillium vulpinum TaxID=29845 RepID=UPI00254741AE|nr:uncharacterized protein N7479_008875 [Penicillium vulpinum]KAJ5950462.1 hypothetical protein N7479_008875 [Penicillium vulpinum]
MTEDRRGITVLHPPTLKGYMGGKSSSQDGFLFEERTTVDCRSLVAIHGLNGDAIDTWTHKKTRIMWLKDLLPEALPNIRIMTYGYDARFKSFTAQQDMRTICSKLLTELVDFRSTQEALLIGCSEEEEQVQKSVYAMLFLGTPHNGSSLAGMGKLVANILSACSPLRPPRTLIGTLQKDSEVLLEITQDFIKRRKQVHIVSFYELEFTSIGPFLKKLIVEQQSAVLNIPDEITIPQFADHRNIVRFRSHQDRSFRPVMSRLKQLADKLQLGFTEQGQTQTQTQSDPESGGSGTTQTALHYILQNMSTYSTGVVFLNATSSVSLGADFDRLHDILNLGESKNKINSVKSWLSKPENRRWILVFDNADDLNSVQIHKYLPSVNWGHVLITSCDQAVIGSIAEEGHVLSSLASEDATILLLESSGIEHPTYRDKEEAKKIVDLLGSLPLALVQAGAFVRSRRRSLREYQDLYLTRRNDLLRFSPRLGFADRAVLTAWEINFKQVEQESPAASSLLLLFSFLDPSSIPEMVLHRGSSPQKRWGENGEVTEVRAQDEGVDEYLTKIIQGDLEFDTAVEKLLSFSLISCNKEMNGLREFSIHPLSLMMIRRSVKFGRILLPHLHRVLSEYDALCVDRGSEFPSFQHELASTLLAASRFSHAEWKLEALSRTRKLLEDNDDPFLNAWLVYRESSLTRMSGMSKESEHILERFLRQGATYGREDSDLTARFNAQRGDLIISFAENLIREGKLTGAKDELVEWKSLGTEYSTLERIVSRARDITLGKVLRYQGLFKEALRLLEGVLRDSLFDEYFEGTDWYRVLLSGVADLYCEIGQPVVSENLLLQELTAMRENGIQDIATGRRLQMSLAETYLQRKMYSEAEPLLLDIHRVVLSSGMPDYKAQVNIFRIWVSLARISHEQSQWEKAISRWRDALAVLGRLKLNRGFNASIVRCSIAHALLMTGHTMECTDILQEARTDMSSEPRVFWIPLFNSKWHDFIIDSLKHVNVS